MIVLHLTGVLGSNVAASYSFQLTQTEKLSSVSIAGITNLVTPAMDEGAIEIQYTGMINSSLGSNLVLTPGSGNIADSACPNADSS